MTSASPEPAPRFLNLLDRHRKWLMAGIMMLYLAGFNGLWRIGEDSAVHMAIARSLAHGEGFVHPTGRDIEVNPGLAYLLAGVFRWMGSGQAGMFAAHVIMLSITASCLGLVYLTFHAHGGRPLAVLVTSMTAVAESFYRYAFTLLADMPFALGFWAFLLALTWLTAERRRPAKDAGALLLMILGMALMAAMRSVFMTVCAAAVLAALWHALRTTGRPRWIALSGLAVLLVAALSWWLAGGARYDQFTLGHALMDQPGQTFARAAQHHLPKLLTETAAEGLLGFDPGPVLGLPLSLYILTSGLLLVRVRPLWGLLVAIFIVQWAAFGVTERYMLPLLPLLAYGWWRAACRVSAWMPAPRVRDGAFTLLAILFVAPNLITCGSLILEQRSRDFYAHYNNGRYEPYLAAGVWLQAHTPSHAQVVMNAKCSAELAVLSSRAVWPFRQVVQADAFSEPLWLLEPIDPRAIRQLQRRGWQPGDVAWSHVDPTGTTWTLRPLTLSRPSP